MNDGKNSAARDMIELLRKAAPERTKEIEEAIERTGFHKQADGPGFEFKNVFGQVVFSDRSLLQVYLLSFLAWRALRAYSGLIILMLYKQLPFNTAGVAHLPEQREADAAVDSLAGTLSELRKAFATIDVPWPKDVPPPASTRHENVEDQAAQEISLLALAFIVLHETHHVTLAELGLSTGDWAEENACDAFARDLLLSSAEEYARSCGDDPDMVRNKRAIAIGLANAIYAEITPKHLWQGSDHPPIADRCFANYAGWPEDRNSSAWVYMASVLAAQLRRRGVETGDITFGSARELCEKLTVLLR